MKQRLGSAIVALGAFAAISIVSTGAHAQQQGGAVTPGGTMVPGGTPAPSGPAAPGVTVTPGYSTTPGYSATPGATGTVPTAPYHPATGEQRTEYLRPNGPLLAAGGLTFLASYVPSFIVALSSDHDDDKWLYLPVAGPFIDLASRGCSDDIQTGTCGTTSWERGALIASGAVQAVGAAMVVGSFFSPSRKIVTTGAVDKPRLLQITPVTLGSRAPGIMAIGTF